MSNWMSSFLYLTESFAIFVKKSICLSRTDFFPLIIWVRTARCSLRLIYILILNKWRMFPEPSCRSVASIGVRIMHHCYYHCSVSHHQNSDLVSCGELRGWGVRTLKLWLINISQPLQYKIQSSSEKKFKIMKENRVCQRGQRTFNFEGNTEPQH